MWNAKIEELRNELNQKVESGICLSTEILEMSRKLDLAINEFYRGLKEREKNVVN